MADSYLIDGYNLIHALGMMEIPHGPQSLERSRRRLLEYLRSSFRKDEAAQVTVVFDAQNAPANVQRQSSYHGLHVEFAPRQWSADDLIETVIAEHSAPRSLIVVSNDTRLQKAARRRGASAWAHDDMLDFFEQRRTAASDSEPTQEDRNKPPSQEERDRWLREFESMESEPEFKEFFDMDRFED